jgi:adenine-specific DNA methylase
MGGGTPLIEANRVGCQVTGFDVNPMAYWIVRQELSYLDVHRYMEAAKKLRDTAARLVGDLYKTTCVHCGSTDADVKYFLWVKAQRCTSCGKEFPLFPGYLVAEDRRHPLNVILCPQCSALNEVQDRRHPGACQTCGSPLSTTGPAKRNRCRCPHCSAVNRYPVVGGDVPHHIMFAIEYYCPACRKGHSGRFFKAPDPEDFARFESARERLRSVERRYIPDEEIPAGDETTRLLRWGYKHYSDLFNERQLLGLATISHLVAHEEDDRTRHALATNLSDLLRYQNMLCRYDTMALKSLDIFSVHGFPVGLVQCESNLLGIRDPDRGAPIGSGGWLNITEKYTKAKQYCSDPFEIAYEGKRKRTVKIRGEWIGDRRSESGRLATKRINLFSADAAQRAIAAGSVDAVFTDPPYYGNVQYAELMDFCYVWLRRLVNSEIDEFRAPTTRTMDELTVNGNLGRDLAHFTKGLSAAFRNAALALKRGSPFAFTYHHNDISAYLPVAVALLDSGLVCTASLPCPAEMGASIHINKTRSSVVDTVFVCRTTGTVRRSLLADTPAVLLKIVTRDASDLRAGGLEPSLGDLRCLAFGHLVRLAVWALREGWSSLGDPLDRTRNVLEWIGEFVHLDQLEHDLETMQGSGPVQPLLLREQPLPYNGDDDEIPF